MEDEKYMELALKLAENGIGRVNPNPLVGAVLVKDGRIIGEGCHEYFGGPHGEINAFLDAERRGLGHEVAGASLYVTLEPCSHYGKTPPCVEAIIKRGIGRVVAAMEDPNPLVAGKGFELLKAKGIDVVTGTLESESRKMNEAFIKYITTKRPFCLMKTAMTLDGKIAAYTGDSKWVTGEKSRAYVHELRHRFSGIMVGIGTVLEDNPSLTTRLPAGEGRDPHRIIVDSKGRTPLDSKILTELLTSRAKTIIAVTTASTEKTKKQLLAMGAEIIVTPEIEGRVDLNFLMKSLGEMGIDSVLLEGGSELNYSALEAGIVDKINTFIAPKIIGGRMGKTTVNGMGRALMEDAWNVGNRTIREFGEDILIEGYVKYDKEKEENLCLQD